MQRTEIEALRAFYEAHRQALHAYALTLTGCSAIAEDVVHTAFYRILRLPAAPENLKAYVYRALRNGAIDAQRRAARSAPEESIIASLNGATPPDQIALQDEAAHLLEVLSGNERACIVMKIYGGLTFQEIAEAQDISPNTAASLYRRGMKKMRLAAEESAP